MKAAVIHEHGGLDILHVEDIEEPKPGPGDVVLRVLCAGLNHLDIWVRIGRSKAKLQKPHVLGSDAVGVVTAVGRDVENPKVGEQVVVNPGLYCGACEFCRRGEQSLCASFGIVGMSRPGTFAEQVAVPAGNCYPKPAHMTDEEAGAFALTSVTAWRMLMTRAQLKAGETVLIHGIGGGVALAALRLAKLAGAEVFVTSSSDEKLAHAVQLGADHTINYRTGNIGQWIQHATSGRGVDIAVDAVGAATWPLDFTTVRKGGRIVICGVTTGARAETDLYTLYWNLLTVLGSTMGSAEDFRAMLQAAALHNLRPVIDEVFPLERVRDAMEKLEADRQFGKIVLRISS